MQPDFLASFTERAVWCYPGSKLHQCRGLLFSVASSVTPGWRQMRVQRDVCLACTLNSPTRCTTSSEVGGVLLVALLFFMARAVEVLHNFACAYVADRLLPGQRGALWLCMMQYCESCTSPRTPEHLLYLYHTHLRSLSWRHLHPDTLLMEQLFNVRPSNL